MHEGGGALVDERFELWVRNVGEGEVENFMGLRDEDGEVAVEEDCVEDSWDTERRELCQWEGSCQGRGEGWAGESL